LQSWTTPCGESNPLAAWPVAPIPAARLQDERWKCPEALFNPGLVGLEIWRKQMENHWEKFGSLKFMKLLNLWWAIDSYYSYSEATLDR